MQINKASIPLTYDTWDKLEHEAVKKILKGDILTQNKTVAMFEKKMAQYHNRKFCLMVNSGSSANLLGVSAMKFKTKLNIKNNDEFLAPGIGWSTSYSPFIQNNLKLKFIDVDLDTFNINPKEIRNNITKKTKGILAINILGNPCEYGEIIKICKEYNLILVEDNCESMGAKFKNKMCGNFGLWSSLSSYFSHHISTIEGGYFLTDDEELYSIALALRSHGWARDQKKLKFFNQSKFTPEKKKFLFFLPGYNIRSSEINAAAGLVQIKKLKKFVQIRRQNSLTIKKIVDSYHKIKIQKQTDYSSWFGFGIIFNTTKVKFKKIINILNKNKIDTRPIVTGDFTKQPVMKYYLYNRKKYNLKNCTTIDNLGIMIGNSHRKFDKFQIQNLELSFLKINQLIN